MEDTLIGANSEMTGSNSFQILMQLCKISNVFVKTFLSGVNEDIDPDFAPPYLLQHRQVK